MMGMINSEAAVLVLAPVVEPQVLGDLATAIGGNCWWGLVSGDR